MSISSSMNAGVAALTVNATKLSAIADNISNSGTNGYKRNSVEFQTMVTPSLNVSGQYSAGGVKSVVTRRVIEPGTIIASSNPTDIAVLGRGFIPVTDINLPRAQDGTYPTRLMTSGSFRPDPGGYLRTETGQLLLGWPADQDGTVPELRRESFDDLEPVQVKFNQFAANPTTEIAISANLPATATQFDATGDPVGLTVNYFDNIGRAQSLSLTFTPNLPAAGSSNEWTLEITDSASGGAAVGEYTILFDDTAALGGSINTVTTIAGGAYDPVLGTITLTLPRGPMTLAIGSPGTSTGLTQLSDSFIPVSIQKNGTPVGSINAVEIDSEGNVYAIFTEGFTRLIYKVPVVNVPHPNGLTAHSNQTYEISREAGEFFLWDAGEGPTGALAGFSLELSNADIGSELTQLIQTQRAYSSGAKVVQTADEMLQETNNLKR
jgi:flagellar hook protein FlgE